MGKRGNQRCVEHVFTIRVRRETVQILVSLIIVESNSISREQLSENGGLRAWTPQKRSKLEVHQDLYLGPCLKGRLTLRGNEEALCCPSFLTTPEGRHGDTS